MKSGDEVTHVALAGRILDGVEGLHLCFLRFVVELIFPVELYLVLSGRGLRAKEFDVSVRVVCSAATVTHLLIFDLGLASRLVSKTV